MNRFFVFTARRLLFVPIAAFVVVSLSFWLVSAIPSNPGMAVLGNLATPAQIHQWSVRVGLSKSIWTRYVDFISNVILHFNLGQSYYSGRSVWADILQYFPSSIELVVMAVIVALVTGLALGTIAAYRLGRSPDHVTRGYIVLVQAVPPFLLGLLVIYLFFYVLGWLPAPTGQLGLTTVPPPARTHAALVDAILSGEWGTALSAFEHAILPVLVLAVYASAVLAKTTRAALGRTLHSSQVEFARALGLRERTVFAYAFRTARTPIVTYCLLIFSLMISGSAIIETIFAWNGLGQWSVQRIFDLDLPEMQGIFLVLGLWTLIILVILDLVVVVLDPRISYG